MAHWHDHNPWANRLIYVSDLAQLVRATGGNAGTLVAWLSYGNKLDGYILPSPSGMHSIGIRYGAKPHEYLSPMMTNQAYTESLIERFGAKP